VPQDQKMAALCTLLHATEGESSLIFGKTKHGVEKLGKQLNRLGFTVGTLHGNKSQHAREAVLTAFRRGQVQTLLATNVAARGLDIHGIHQVINYELPESSELLTHRIGRTGRMGRYGKAITLLAPGDVPKWRRMARDLGQVVALRQLVLDEEAAALPPLALAETPNAREYEQQAGRDRNSESLDQEHGRRGQSEYNSYPSSSTRRRQKEKRESETATRGPEWQPEDVRRPARARALPERAGRKEAGRPSRFGRSTERREVYAFAESAPRYRAARRKPGTRAAQRRPSTSRRFASR
jgi:superfamily II DNA/RNA helicase